MAIEKYLGQQLESMENEAMDSIPESELVENPEGTTEYIYEDELEAEIGHDENLVSYLSDDFLELLASDVIDDCASDRESRKDWQNTIVKGMDLLGLKLSTQGAAFEGACTAHHPLIIEAATKFQSKASVELFPAKGPVHTQIMGIPTPEKEAQAKRVKDHLNYQTVHEMEENFPDTEKMLFELPIVGSAFKKTYWDSSLNRPVSEFIPVEYFDVPYNASDLRRAPRYTHTIPLTKIEYDQRAFNGLYDESVDIGEPTRREVNEIQEKMDSLTGQTVGNSDRDEVYTLLEQHVHLVIPVEAGHPVEMEDVALPYVITVEKSSSKVVAIRRLWEEEDENYEKQVVFTHYPFVPGMGFFGFGYIHLLGNFQMTLTAALRSLIDSGQFANMQGGFKSKQMRIKDDGPITPGEFREVEATGMKLGDLIMPLPFKEPSTVLFQMLDYLSAAGQKFADSTEQVIQDSTNYGPVGTTMALLEASTKFFTAIHKRLHFAQKHELQIIAKLNYQYIPEEGYMYDVVNGEISVTREDFDGRIDVIPVSDPNISSQSQRVAQAESIVESAMRAPDIHDLRAAFHSMYMTMGIDNIDKILPPPPEAQPQDPMSDIFAAVKGQPIKAFPGQDHDAHVTVKMSWMQDPANGANELMIKTMPIIEANIQEHMVTKYQEQIQGMVQQSGFQPTGAATDENTLAMIQAKAAQEIQFANQQADLEGALETPEMMLANAEVESVANKVRNSERDYEIKTREVDIKEFEAIVDAKEKGIKLELEGSKISQGEDKIAADLVKAKMSEKSKAKTTK